MIMSVDHFTETDSGIEKAPVSASQSDNALYLWVIIGSSIGGAVILTAIIATAIYLKHRSSKNKKARELERPRYILGGEFGYKNNKDRTSFSSTGSNDDSASETSSTQEPAVGRSLRHCVSFNSPGILRTTSECVQPKQSLRRWNSTSSAHCQSTAAVPGTLETCQEDLPVSDDEGPVSPSCLNGRLWFSILFRPDDEELKVTLVKAKYLPGRGLTNSPRDPYVKIFLLPDEETCHQSKIRKRTLAPKFNETFTFKVNSENLVQKSVRFSIYDVDKRKVRHNLGHVIFPLTRSELLNDSIVWKNLETTTQQLSTLGEIQISFGYNPYTSKIKVTVGSVRNMRGITADDFTVYVKIQLYHGHKLMKVKRTVPQALPCNAKTDERKLLFDETFNFGVSGRFFDSCSFTFTVMLANPSQLLQEKPHGRIVIGPFMYARGDQLQHWQEMLTNQRNIVTRWHNLETVISN